MKLTKTVVEKIPYTQSGQKLYWDDDLKGFGLRAGTVGKTYIAETKVNGKTVRVTIGKHGVFTAEQARNEARQLLGLMAKKINPNAVRLENKIKDLEQEARAITLSEVFHDYLKARKTLKPKTLYDYRRVIEIAFGDWKDKPLLSITKDKMAERHTLLGKNQGEAYANLSMRLLRALFNFAAGRYEDAQGRSLIAENPVKRLSQTRAWYRMRRRDSYIKPHELPAWFKAVQRLDNDTVRDYLLLLLFTGLRRQEAARLTWDNVDFKARTLTVTDTKNHQNHTLPLSDFIFDLFQRRRTNAVSAYVFPGGGAGGYLVEPRTPMARVIKESEVTFTLHDLRRTFATCVNNLDHSLSYFSIKRLLNHKSNDVTAGYIQHDIEQLREPMQKITDYILKCAGIRASAEVLKLKTAG
jgi:integrase